MTSSKPKHLNLLSVKNFDLFPQLPVKHRTKLCAYISSQPEQIIQFWGCGWNDSFWWQNGESSE